MPTGTNIRTYFQGQWHDGDLAVMKAADHGMWLGSNVFDGARYAHGLTPDLDRHCARVNASAEALMVTPTVGVAEMVAIIHDGLRAYPKDAAVYIRPMYWAIMAACRRSSPRRAAAPASPSVSKRYRWPQAGPRPR